MMIKTPEQPSCIHYLVRGVDCKTATNGRNKSSD